MIEADFFSADFSRPFDYLYHRAFITAIPLELRPRYAATVKELIRPGGLMVGFHLFSNHKSSTPRGLSDRELDNLFGDAFVLMVDKSVDKQLPFFIGEERWQVWKRI